MWLSVYLCVCVCEGVSVWVCVWGAGACVGKGLSVVGKEEVLKELSKRN